jgi:hypothetical protein
LDLNLAIENTDMSTMTDLMRAYANFDVAAGNFSMFSEIKVRQGKIDGYVSRSLAACKSSTSAPARTKASGIKHTSS